MATNEPPQEAMVMYKAKLGRRSIPKCFADMAKFCVEPMPRNRPRFKVMLEFLETQVLKKTLVAANTTNTSVEKEEKKNSSEMVDNSTGGEGLGDETHGAERTKKKIVMDDQAFIKLLASVPAFNPSTSSKDQQKMPGNAIYGDLEAELFGETRGGHQAPQLALGGRGEGLRLGLGAGGGGGASVRSSNAAKVNQHLKPPSAAEGKSDAYSYQTTNYEAQTTPRSEQQQRQQECEEDIDITSNSWLKSEFASEKKDVSLEWDDDDDEGRENKNSTRFKHLCRCIIL